MKAAIYTRYSTDRQRETSTEDQLRECRKKASQLGLEVDDAHLYSDEAISGSRHDRPAYLRLMEAAKRRQFTAVIVHTQARLGRDQPEAEMAFRKLEFAGVRVVTCAGYDTATLPEKMRKLNRGMQGIMDEAYTSEAAENTHRGQTGQVERGYWAGGRPYGYQLKQQRDASRRDQYGEPLILGTVLVVDEKEARIIRRIFREYSEGKSPQAIAAQLNTEHVPPPGAKWSRKPRPAMGWQGRAIREQLRNDIYRGLYVWNTTRWAKHPETGRKVVLPRPESEWLRLEKPEWRIVDDEQWNKVQEALRLSTLERGAAISAGIKVSGYKPGGGPKHLLSGLLVCGQCGRPMVVNDSRNYACSTYRNSGKAACSSSVLVRRDRAEDRILPDLLAELREPKWQKAFEVAVQKVLAAKRKGKGAVSEEAARERRTAQLRAEVGNLVEAIAAGGRKASPSLLDRLSAAEIELGQLEAEARARKAAPGAEVTRLLPRVLERFSGLLAEFPARARRSPRDIALVRQSLRTLLEDGVIRIEAEEGSPVAVYSVSGRAILKAVGAETAFDSVVAGAGFEPATFGL